MSSPSPAPEGTLILDGRRFPIVSATFRRITDDGSGKPGWAFDIRTSEPPDVDEEDLFSFTEARLYADGDAIPLPDLEDLTGQVVQLESPYDDVSGDVYFTLYVFEHEDLSGLTLTFRERRGERYRITIEAKAHFGSKRLPLAVNTWIERLPPKSYVRSPGEA